MNKNIIKRNELLAQKVIKGLESRNMEAFYAADREEALKKALELIPKDSVVTMGGCMSAVEIGLVDALKSGEYRFLDRDTAPDREAAMRESYNADWFIASANGMTEDGVMVNIDGKLQPCLRHSSGPQARAVHRRHEQDLHGRGSCLKEGKKRCGAYKRSAFRA